MTIMTGDYSCYFKNFIDTLVNFMPNVKKNLVVISDRLKEYDNKYINGIHVQVKYISDFPYPTINRNKYQILYDNVKDMECEYIAYFDADTVFLKRSTEFWNKIESLVKAKKTICPLHPFYNPGELVNYDNKIDRRFMISTEPKYFYADSTLCNFDFINEKSNWIIVSMFILNIDRLKEISEKIKILTGKTEREWLRILKFPEESLFNLMYYFDYLNGDESKYHLDKYIIRDINYVPNESLEYFIVQKYDNDKHKSSKKYSYSKKTILIHPTEAYNRHEKELFYRFLAKHAYDSNIILIFNESFNKDIKKKLIESLPIMSFQTFWDINFKDENLFFKRSYYVNHFPILEYNDIIVINKINDSVINIDFDSFCNNESIIYKSDKSFEDNRHFKDVNWMYFTKEFIQQNWIND